jgi:hypothetical protein
MSNRCRVDVVKKVLLIGLLLLILISSACLNPESPPQAPSSTEINKVVEEYYQYITLLNSDLDKIDTVDRESFISEEEYLSLTPQQRLGRFEVHYRESKDAWGLYERHLQDWRDFINANEETLQKAGIDTVSDKGEIDRRLDGVDRALNELDTVYDSLK